MKILQISPEAPGKKSGGALAIYQTVASVKEIQNVQIDYIVPEIHDNDIRTLYTVIHELHASKNILLRAFNLIFHKMIRSPKVPFYGSSVVSVGKKLHSF